MMILKLFSKFKSHLPHEDLNLIKIVELEVKTSKLMKTEGRNDTI